MQSGGEKRSDGEVKKEKVRAGGGIQKVSPCLDFLVAKEGRKVV